MILDEDNRTFAETLAVGDIAALARFAKGDRHCHSLLGASMRSIRAWARTEIPDPPRRMADFDEMRRYCHDELYGLIQNRRGFEFTARQTLEESILDGVTILEMSLDVSFSRFYEDGMDGFLELVSSLTQGFRGKVDFRPEVGVSRNRDPSTQVPLALACVDSGLFRSIDLYGNEHAREPESYASLYRHARYRGLRLKAHVGEFGGPQDIEETIRALDLDEVQHGVTAARSAPLMGLLRSRKLRLNVCPSSNVALSVCRDLAHHPIRILVDNGVRVSINSDDKTIFGRTASEEYLGLFAASTLSAEELEAIRMDSMRD